MIHIEKILVPIDFSEPSLKAMKYGLSFAMEFKAKLFLAHIVPDYSALNYTFPAESFDLQKQSYKQAREMLPEVVPAEFRDKVSVEIIAKGGEVRSELRGIVEDEEIDLVVMGTHGRNYLERLVLGSVTERMLRQLPVPVMTVSHLDPEKELPVPGIVPIRRILYATDLSEGSEPGLQFAIRFARGLDARLTVVHVLENLQHMFVGADMAAYMPSYEGNVREMTREKLNRVVALHSDGSVPITTVLENGIPYQAINRVAVEINADLIVMNLHGKGRLERALLGSTAERVIRTATIPVLSLPLPGVYVPRWVAA